jgi:hypothetical protein
MVAIRAPIRNPEAESVPFPERSDLNAEQIAAVRDDLLYHWQIGTDAAPVQRTSRVRHGTGTGTGTFRRIITFGRETSTAPASMTAP